VRADVRESRDSARRYYTVRRQFDLFDICNMEEQILGKRGKGIFAYFTTVVATVVRRKLEQWLSKSNFTALPSPSTRFAHKSLQYPNCRGTKVSMGSDCPSVPCTRAAVDALRAKADIIHLRNILL